jgi:YbgC/YbaW family acyl-CoA thioester hydrolase
MKRADFRFFHRLRVRWAEVDMQKIVFNAHYLMYFDTAIADYWRALALPYEASMHQLDGDLYVVKATVEFHASARVDDQIEVAMKCSRIGTSSMTFTGAIFRGEEHLISCELVYVFADPVTQTSRPVPPALRDIVLGYEAGEAMVTMKVGGWSELGDDARRIRTAVFVEEQRIPKDLESDAADLTAVHAVAYNRLGPARGDRALRATRARCGEGRTPGGAPRAARRPSRAPGVDGADGRGPRRRGTRSDAACAAQRRGLLRAAGLPGPGCVVRRGGY